MKPSGELLNQCKDDNRKAHYELYQMCFSFIVSVCARYYVNHDDRMAALNMIFFRMIKNIRQYISKSDHVPFELWVKKISVNYVIDEFRKNKKYKEVIDLQELYTDDQLNQSNDPVGIKMNTEVITDAIAELPAMNRTVFNLYVIDGYKHEEIAQMLGISENTSKVHLHRAKNKLKEILKNVRADDSGLKIIF
jgi:RNA polymerase sigma factor (sigma-70 family)